MTDLLRVVVVDDEQLAREELCYQLGQLGDIDVVAQAANGVDALATVDKHEPDLVFLDVQMPGADGFDVIDAVGPDKMPFVVFVTAYDRYALQAFEVHALDYVLKPFDPARFEAAVRHAVEQVRLRRADLAGQRLAALLRDLPPALESVAGTYATRILVRQGEGFGFVETARVDWLEAAGNYVRLHADGRSWLIRATLGSVMTSLDPARFVRIHRSTIVNVDRVREVQPWGGGDYIAILTDGRQLRVSRTHRDELLRPFA
jgi:two-component system, LytTR family, response regulator